MERVPINKNKFKRHQLIAMYVPYLNPDLNKL